MNVTIWNEYRHEPNDEEIRKIYPEGIHGAIKSFLEKNDDLIIRTATLDEPEHGLSTEVLNTTDVLLWWGHMAHGEVSDAIAERVKERVQQGMGLIVLHSAHYSKVFQKLMGTTCSLKWRDIGEKERLWLINPTHPIAQGVPEVIDIEHEEMYGEHFDIPTPDELIFLSWFKGGNVFRSGITYTRGRGKIFYFQPGHEAFTSFYHPEIQKIITNAVYWAKSDIAPEPIIAIHDAEPGESLDT